MSLRSPGGWKLRAEDQVEAVGNFATGSRQHMLLTSSRDSTAHAHLGVIGITAEGVKETVAALPEGSTFGPGGWRYSASDVIAGHGPILGNGRDQVVQQPAGLDAVAVVGFDNSGAAPAFTHPGWAGFRLPSGERDLLEVFGQSGVDTRVVPAEFECGVLIALAVDDVGKASQELAAAGIELLGDLVWASELTGDAADEGWGWVLLPGTGRERLRAAAGWHDEPEVTATVLPSNLTNGTSAQPPTRPPLWRCAGQPCEVLTTLAG